MQSAKARPGRRIFGYEQPTPAAIPRPPLRLIAAPLQRTPPETGAALFRETRGRAGTQRPPFPGRYDPAAVLAVKGSLRRFAPWTAPGRREKTA
jgi:hypothetical protein